MKKKRLIINTATVIKRMNGNQFLIKELYRIYLEQINEYIQNIQESFVNRDFNQISDYCHSLETCLQSVGADRCEDTNNTLSYQIKTGKINSVSDTIDELIKEFNILFLKYNDTNFETK